MSDFKNIPTNIISGFLGAGKTTAIQYCLKHKPASEIWAVIVNEFGQIGVDGALLKNTGVAIKEIPGGCLCCVGSQSLNVGLNQIIRSVNPDRILIEPTGLGHLAKLIESLTGEFYHSVLNLKAVINLIDARNLNDERYLNNETFAEQSKLADILVATKSDVCSENDREQFRQYAQSFSPEKIQVDMIKQGQLNLQWLDIDRGSPVVDEINTAVLPHSHAAHQTETVQSDEAMHWQMQQGNSDGFYSLGWKIKDSTVFQKNKLIDFIETLRNDIAIERIKAVVKTDEGWITVNVTRYESEILKTVVHTGAVLEMISEESLDASSLNARLKYCRK